jgi:hypothetical protein
VRRTNNRRTEEGLHETTGIQGRNFDVDNELLVTRILQSLAISADKIDLLTEECGSLVNLVACETSSNSPE